MAATGRLAGRVAVVTGGARGQGRAIAAKFASEGADVAILDLCSQISTIPYPMANPGDLKATAELVESAGVRCVSEVVDVRDQEALEAFNVRVVEELGPIDVLCANAGIVNFAPFWELSEEAWQNCIDVNLTGVWKTVRAFAPSMMERRSGSIVLTSSVNGREAGPEMTHYVAAKHGVIGLLRSFAYELGPFGVRVNAVLPGPILTPMANNDATRSWIFRQDGATLDDYLTATRNWHLLRGRPSLAATAIADAMIWLASDESQHVTGIEIPVDAGHMILPGMNPAPIVDPDGGEFDYEATALSPSN